MNERPLSKVMNLFNSLYLFLFFQTAIPRIRTESHIPSRILYTSWLLFALIFTSTYSSVFYSYLTVHDSHSPIDTLEDLEKAARTDSHFVLSMNNSAYVTQFLNAPVENVFAHTVGEHIRRSQRPMVTNQADLLRLAEEDPRNIVITGRSYLTEKLIEKSRKSLHISSENIGSHWTGMILPKGSPLRRPFNVM